MPSEAAIAHVRKWYEREGFESKGENIDEGPYIGMLADLLDAFALSAAEAMKERAANVAQTFDDLDGCTFVAAIAAAIRTLPTQEPKK